MRYHLRLQHFVPCVAAVLLCIGATDALAQSVEPCREEVERAEEHYRDGDFEEAERLLVPCLDQALMSDSVAVRGYRILAQAKLQTGDIAGARRAVLRVFARNPGYRSDPVQDPPAYQALVETVRQQLDDPAFVADLEQVRRQRVAAEPDPRELPEYRAVGRFFLQAGLGSNSYGGERGVDAGSRFSEFTQNAGLAFSLAAGYNVSDYVSVVLSYDPGRLPTVLNEEWWRFPDIDQEESSTWLHTLNGSVVTRVLPRRLATPYLRGGVGASFIRINEARRGGVAFDLGLGVDVAAAPSIGLHAEMVARYTFPGDAIDTVDNAGTFDLVSLLRAGISWNVGSVR